MEQGIVNEIFGFGASLCELYRWILGYHRYAWAWKLLQKTMYNSGRESGAMRSDPEAWPGLDPLSRSRDR